LISEEELMDARALARQGYTYAEIGRLLGRDWRTVKRYLETGAQPVYRRRRMASKLDEFKPVIDQWLAATPGLLATRIHQDLVRDYGFEGGYNTVRRYVERSRPRPTPRASERFETRRAIRRRLTGRTNSRSRPARGWNCRSTAFTWSSGTLATRSAR
jgi:transposase